jgi:hypothetical protein
MTVLEAKVEHARRAELERAYQEGTATLPQAIVETFLVRDSQDDTLHRIVTVWASREALDEMRASGVKPKGVQIFEAAGASPTLSVFDVLTRQTH